MKWKTRSVTKHQVQNISPLEPHSFLPAHLVHLLLLPVLIMCLCSHSFIYFLHFHILGLLGHLFSSLTRINCNLQRLGQLLVRLGLKDGWMIRRICVILCTDALFVCACARARTLCMRYDANRTNCLGASLFWCLLPPPLQKKKGSAQNHARKHTFCVASPHCARSLVFKWLSLASNTKAHFPQTNPSHENNMRLFIAAKFNCELM